LIQVNPFAGLGIGKGKGNGEKQPPDQQQAWTLLRHARELTPPSFAAYLEVACLSAARPGELDALTWNAVDFEHDEIHVREQWNAKTRRFTLPKHRHVHTITLTPIARDCLLGLPRESQRCFTTLRGTHYTPSSRTHHWNRIRAAAGLGNVTLYMATRHLAGWYMLHVLDLPAHVIAEQLGHRDGGTLVTQLYGHPDGRRARRKIHEAYERSSAVKPLRVVAEEGA
jgi:integrase